MSTMIIAKLKIMKNEKMKIVLLLIGLFIGISSFSQTEIISDIKNVIKPYSENPGYWQYRGKPILLIGGTDNDNLFQNKNMKTHLDSLKDAGGNYIRNTMSDRDMGDEKAFFRNIDGKYDLSKWNDVYWDKFENLLRLTNERDIIVQIEIWDRFDHSREPWLTDPYNPGNNINYTYEQAKLDSLYPKHPGSNTHPFFFTVPTLNNNALLLQYQKAFADKMLSISLQYGNVLYCIDNETKGAEEWAIFWADYVKCKAGEKEIYITQMWDDWDVKSEMHKRTINNPDRYSYIDISQNSQTPGHDNWENAQYVFNYISKNPRPVNSTKIYGNDTGKWAAQAKNSEHAVQTFFRNLIGGFASSRFHRSPGGLGLSHRSINAMKTVREIETIVKFREISPRMDLLTENEKGEAYISAKEGEYYLIYFTDEGNVKLDLSKQKGIYTTRWIDINKAEWIEQKEIKAGILIELTARNKNGCIVVLQRKDITK